MALLIQMLVTIFARNLNIHKGESIQLNPSCKTIEHTNVFAETHSNYNAFKLLKKYDTTSIFTLRREKKSKQAT